MNSILKTLVVAVAVVGLAACAEQGKSGAATGSSAGSAQKEMEAAGKKLMTEEEIKKAFKSGANADWTAGDVKGEDAYFATVSPWQGDADRYVGTQAMQGTWQVKGDTLCTTFQGKEDCVRLFDMGKNEFRAVRPDGSLAMDMKLKS